MDISFYQTLWKLLRKTVCKDDLEDSSVFWKSFFPYLKQKMPINSIDSIFEINNNKLIIVNIDCYIERKNMKPNIEEEV